MKNSLFFKLKSKIKLNIKGKNIERFIKRLVSNKIELLKINYINYNQVSIVVYKDEYDKIMNLKSIYEVTLLDIYGIIKVRKVIDIYKYIIILIFIGIACIIFLSKIIFNVEVIYNDSEVRKFMITELENYDIKKYKFKKSFNEIQKIKSEILEKYKDKIEWLEIEESGTKYIVRLEERIIPDNNEENEKQNIVSSKSAIIRKIIAEEGQIIKEPNTFVNKNDVIISGNISFNNEIKETIKAKGTVYGEVWYKVTVEYPYVYNEIKETGNYRNIYVLKILNKEIEFTFKKFKNKKYTDKIILANSILPISLVKQHQSETDNISLFLTVEEATIKAIEEANKKIKESLSDDENIIDYKVLTINSDDEKVSVDIFFTVYENITSYSKIEGEEIVP